KALQTRAAERGIPWNDKNDGVPGNLRGISSEEGIYARLGLPFIEPELHEGLGEIGMAEAGGGRDLLISKAIQGVFHNHTSESDGTASLEEMVDRARTLGYRYIGISDHSQSAYYARGLKEDRVREQHAAIDTLRKKVRG